MRLKLLPVILLCVLAGCGRMLPPFAPEDLAPKPVQNLEVSALADGVQFAWLAPERDIRGEELRSLDFYEIERKLIEDPSDVVDETVPYEEVGLVQDRYFTELRRQQDQQVAQGLPKRKASVDASFKKHQFIDRSLVSGSRYLYRITGVNQGDEAGAVDTYIDVDFAGANSTITLASDLEDAEAVAGTTLEGDDNSLLAE